MTLQVSDTSLEKWTRKRSQQPIASPSYHFQIDVNSPEIFSNSKKDHESSLLTNDQTNSKTMVRDIPARYCVFFFAFFVLVIARYSVPDNEVPCVVDKVMNSLQGANSYILAHPFLRDTMQIICSTFMDTMAFATLFYWIYHGTSSRLLITIALFYGVRALVQSIWYSPYPEGFWWSDPGVPSLVVPYGRGSDFFFSGHAGFVVICGSEWWKTRNLYMLGYIVIGGIYTAFVLVLFRIHYSIDVFAGVIVAHWCFMIVDMHKDKLDNMVYKVHAKIRSSIESENREIQLQELRQRLFANNSRSIFSRDLELQDIRPQRVE